MSRNNKADLATERERQLTTGRANQTTGLTNGWAANWQRKSRLVLSARFPVVNWRSRSVSFTAASGYKVNKHLGSSYYWKKTEILSRTEQKRTFQTFNLYHKTNPNRKVEQMSFCKAETYLLSSWVNKLSRRPACTLGARDFSSAVSSAYGRRSVGHRPTPKIPAVCEKKSLVPRVPSMRER